MLGAKRMILQKIIIGGSLLLGSVYIIISRRNDYRKYCLHWIPTEIDLECIESLI